MVRAIRGVLVECDPAIKSIIVNIDSERHEFIIEDLDDQRLVINENMMETLKRKLEDVRRLPRCCPSFARLFTNTPSASRRPSRRRRCRTRTRSLDARDGTAFWVILLSTHMAHTCQL